VGGTDRRGALAGAAAAEAERGARARDEAITWEIGIPLVTNPRLVRTMAVVAALSALIPVLLMTVIFGSQGDWEAVLMVARIFAVVGVGLFIAMLLVMALVFRNRIQTRFSVTRRGIAQETVDRVATGASRLAVLAGALGRSPGTAGAGLLAMSRESEALEWDGAFRLSADPRRRMLSFRNAWRPLMDVYCTADNYDAVEELVRRYMAENETALRVAKRSPLPSYLLHSALILVASFPIFAAYEEHGLDVLVPIIAVAFAFATLWLVPLFGYVVLLANAWIALSLAVALLGERTSMFATRETYRVYEVLSGADWAALALALLGLGYLTWLSIRALRGQLMSLLIRDAADMDG